MSIKDIVRDFLRTSQTVLLPKQISDTLNLNANTVRRVMQELRDDKSVQRDPIGYFYDPSASFVYKFTGYKDGLRYNPTFTTDRTLSSQEVNKLGMDLLDDYGNVSLVAEGEGDYDPSVEGWDYGDGSEES